MCPKLNLVYNHMTVEIVKQDASIWLELCKLKTDPFYTFTKGIDVLFWETTAVEKYPFLWDFVFLILSMFRTTYIWELTFFSMKHIKSKK